MLFKVQKTWNKIIIEFLGIKVKFKRKDIKSFVEMPIISSSEIPSGSYIGKYATIGKNVHFYGAVKIGRYTTIAETARIGACNHPIYFLTGHAVSYVSQNIFKDAAYKKIRENNKQNKNVIEFEKRQKIDDKYYCVIGNDVYIGTNVVILSGVTIGDGAVIGAGAIVTKDVPPFAIVVGCPAKILKYRFNDNIINELLNLKWWNLDTKDLINLDLTNVKDCIEKLKFLKQ